MEQKAKYITIRAVRFCIAVALFVSISSVSYSILMYSFYGIGRSVRNEAVHIMNKAASVHIARIVFSLVIYTEIFEIFIKTDRTARKKYLQDKNAAGIGLAYAVRTPDFWVSFALTAFLFIFFPNLLPIQAFGELLLIPYALSYGIIAVVFTVALIFAWHSGIVAWKTARKDRNDLLVLTSEVLFIAISFSVIAYFLPPFTMVAYGAYRLILTFGLQILLIILGAFLVFKAVCWLRAFFIRVRFIGKLKKAAVRNGWMLSEIAHPYSSVFADHDGASFTVHANEKTYSCKFLSGIHYSYPMYFDEKGEGVIIHHITMRYRAQFGWPFSWTWNRLPDDLMQFHTPFKYSFDGDGKKVLILSPTPHKIFAALGGQTKEIDVGDTVYGYTVSTGTSFINFLERNCL